MAVGLASRRAGPALTAFDDRLYHTLVTLAADTGRVQIGIRQLADLVDVSTRSVRDSQHRLVAAGRITVVPADVPGGSSTIMVLPQGDLTGGVGSRQPHPGAGRAASPTPASPATAQNLAQATTPRRDPDPDCPVCDGGGWVFLPEVSNTVEPCRCLVDDYRAWWRAQRRRILNNWPRPKSHDEPPSKADYNATMLEWNRRQLAEAKPPPPQWSRSADDDDPKF